MRHRLRIQAHLRRNWGSTTWPSPRRPTTTDPYDASGIPQLDYHGHIGLQYNPIAIAQFGLGNYNLWKTGGIPMPSGKILSDCRLARFASRTEFSRTLSLEPSLRLGVSRHPQGSLVFGSWRKGREFQFWSARTRSQARRAILSSRGRLLRAFSSRSKTEVSPSPMPPEIFGSRSTLFLRRPIF